MVLRPKGTSHKKETTVTQSPHPTTKFFARTHRHHRGCNKPAQPAQWKIYIRNKYGATSLSMKASVLFSSSEHNRKLPTPKWPSGLEVTEVLRTSEAHDRMEFDSRHQRPPCNAHNTVQSATANRYRAISLALRIHYTRKYLVDRASACTTCTQCNLQAGDSFSLWFSCSAKKHSQLHSLGFQFVSAAKWLFSFCGGLSVVLGYRTRLYWPTSARVALGGTNEILVLKTSLNGPGSSPLLNAIYDAVGAHCSTLFWNSGKQWKRVAVCCSSAARNQNAASH